MKTETQRFHVVLLPQEKQHTQMVQLSQDLNVSGTNTIELGPEMIPHITLYNPEIPVPNVTPCLSAIEQIVKDINIESCSLANARYEKAPEDNTGLFINYDYDTDIARVRRQVIDAVNPFREGVVGEKWIGNTECIDEIKQYGYPLSQYHFPHVTLAQFSSRKERDSVLESLANKGVPAFIPQFIAVAQTGPHGTVKKIVKKWVL